MVLIIFMVQKTLFVNLLVFNFQTIYSFNESISQKCQNNNINFIFSLKNYNFVKLYK